MDMCMRKAFIYWQTMSSYYYLRLVKQNLTIFQPNRESIQIVLQQHQSNYFKGKYFLPKGIKLVVKHSLMAFCGLKRTMLKMKRGVSLHALWLL